MRRDCCLREVVVTGGSTVWMFSLGPTIGSFHETRAQTNTRTCLFFQWICYLYFHASWMNDLDFIAIATPHFVVYYCHTTNGMVRATEIQQVVIVEVPLTIWEEQKQDLQERFWFECPKYVAFVVVLHYQCQARENMQQVPSAGKHVTSDKRGNACSQCQARKYIQPVLCAGKQAREPSRYWFFSWQGFIWQVVERHMEQIQNQHKSGLLHTSYLQIYR